MNRHIDPRKPKGSRNITVGDQLYYWIVYGAVTSPKTSGAFIWDSETQQKYDVSWEDIAKDDDGVVYPVILPRHVAAWIKKNMQP